LQLSFRTQLPSLPGDSSQRWPISRQGALTSDGSDARSGQPAAVLETVAITSARRNEPGQHHAKGLAGGG
jgi:hypothetical protein